MLQIICINFHPFSGQLLLEDGLLFALTVSEKVTKNVRCGDMEASSNIVQQKKFIV